MKLAQKVLQMLEGYNFASTQFPMPPDVQKVVKQFQKEIDPEDWAEEGKETDIHLTLMYGITGGMSSKRLVQRFLQQVPPLKVRMSRIEVFTPNEEHDVIVIRVVGQSLHALRRKLEAAVPNEQTFPTYKPHITVGYVKKGTGAKYEFKVPDIEIELTEVDYSTKQGTKTRIKLGSANA